MPARELIARAERLAAADEWNQARAVFTEALSADPSPAILVAFAIALAERDQYVESLRLLHRAWSDACSANDPRQRATCGINLAIIYRRLGNAPLAKQYQQLSLAAEMETPDYAQHATLSTTQLIEAAATSSDDGEQIVAERLLSAAQCAAPRTGATDVAAEDSCVEGNLAVVRARRGLILPAVDRLFHSARQHAKRGEGPRRAHDLTNLGHLLQGIGRATEATWCFREAAKEFAHSGAEIRRRELSQFACEARRRMAHASCQPLDN